MIYCKFQYEKASYENRLEHLQMKSLSQRRRNIDETFLFKIVNSFLQSEILSKMVFHSPGSTGCNL